MNLLGFFQRTIGRVWLSSFDLKDVEDSFLQLRILLFSFSFLCLSWSTTTPNFKVISETMKSLLLDKNTSVPKTIPPNFKVIMNDSWSTFRTFTENMCVFFFKIWFWFFHDFNTNLFERNQVSCCPSLGQDPKRGFAGSGQRPPRVEQIINGVKVGFTSWVLLKGPSVPTSKWSMFIFFPPFEKTYAFEKGGFCEIRNPVTGLSVVPWLVLDTFRYHWSGVAPARSTGLWLVCFFGVALMEESCWMYIENVEVSLWPAETNICYTKVVATRSFVEAWIWWRVFLTVWTLI